MKIAVQGAAQGGPSSKLKQAVQNYAVKHRNSSRVRCKAKPVSRRFRLQQEHKTGRVLIGVEQEPGCVVLETTIARCWIEAKRKFGFQLSPMQKELLAKVQKRASYYKRRRTAGRMSLAAA